MSMILRSLNVYYAGFKQPGFWLGLASKALPFRLRALGRPKRTAGQSQKHGCLKSALPISGYTCFCHRGFSFYCLCTLIETLLLLLAITG